MKGYSADELRGFQELLKPYRRNDGTYSYAVLAKRLGERRTTWAHRTEMVMAAENKGDLGVPFEAEETPSELAPISEIIEARAAEFQRKRAHEEATKLIKVRVRVNGPYGIAHFGDPHVDDAGCDIRLLQNHINIVKKTKGLFAGNIGDMNNNWIGRLERLHGKQKTTTKEAWALVEWMLTEMPWLYVIMGNHDAWSGDRDPLEYILRHQPGAKGKWGARLELIPPKGTKTRINARHDFRGRSEYNIVHALIKAVRNGWRDHILIAGHTHTSGYAIEKCPASGLISHMIRVAGYKVLDDFPKELNLPDQSTFPSCITVIDPDAPDTSSAHVTFFPDMEHGADYLTYLRKKRGV
jgi:hypothetical protein